ncbi:uncharacterized protein [Triticum aestivum]|uniref:uncharacterized protein n=1 Tax=Triticum aestivum TaxID=4565 RepID=UPI001D02AA6E|nr:uncharacterized protein LOC123169437 [Triticum aestivum]
MCAFMCCVRQTMKEIRESYEEEEEGRCGEEAAPIIGIMSLVVLGGVRRAGGVPVVTAFAGGCAKLRAVCRSMDVRGAAAVMADAEVARGESAASAADMEASAAVLGESAVMQCDAVRATSNGERGGEEVVEDLRDGAEAAVARRDDRGGAVVRRMEMWRVGGGRCGAVRRHEAASEKARV